MRFPKPTLDAHHFGAHHLYALSDEPLFQATGVRIAFTSRAGGVSDGPFGSLNLGSHVHDDPLDVAENRRILAESFDAASMPLIIPNQIHGTHVLEIDSNEPVNIERIKTSAADGADGILLSVPRVAINLNYADCMPVIIVSSTKRVAVVHAGWRGAVGGIAGKALQKMRLADKESGVSDALYNAYIGPYIHQECFETGQEVYERFAGTYGPSVVNGTHVDLGRSVSIDLERAGLDLDRICDVDICTVCNHDSFYSYRASGGTCGRHGAFACIKE